MSSHARSLLCGIAVALVASVPFHAHALYKRGHATYCLTGNSPFLQNTINGPTNDGSSISRTILCPFPEDSNFPKTNASAVSISYTSDDSSPLDVKACVTFFTTSGGLGGDCGLSDTTAPYNPSLLKWTSSSSTAYVAIRLPVNDGTLGTMIHGVRFDD
jgi:hypothetical protein